MELFLLYESCFTTGSIFNMGLAKTHVLSLIIGASIWTLLFLLQGAGLWIMAKNRGWKNKGLVFVPFVNYLYISKLAGVCNFFSQKIKNMGIFVMIAQIVATLFSVALLTAKTYLFVVDGEPVFLDDYGTLYWGAAGVAARVEDFYNIGSSISYILQLIYEIMLLILTMGLFKRYAPKNYMLLSLIGVFIPMSRFIVIFCLRNKQAIDYEAYIRARREAMAREYQQRYGGGYGTPYGGNPYGTPYGNGYGNGYGNVPPTPPQKPEDPFGEFGDKKGEDVPFGEFDGNGTSVAPEGKDDGFFQ